MSKSSLRSKSSARSLRANRSPASLRRRQDIGKPSVKPYGFCCSRTDNHPLKTNAAISLSIGSLGSLHECPALRLREHVISKRPRPPRPKDGVKTPRSSSALKLSLQSLQEPGGLLLDKDATESALELMREIVRGRRQMEYEQRMDRWAAIGERRVKSRKKKLKKGGKPYWYTDFSIPQLQKLKELEDSLFKDKEEKTTSRTLNSLFDIGMMTDEVKIEPREVSRLLNEFSADPIKFLCELYKAISGQYFDNEDYRRDYRCSERIILSGIAFLELPRIVLTLHDRLPPIVKLKLPPKPKPPQALRAKKMESPLLEELHLPVNWRLYETELTEWRKKYFAIPRPIAILPKQITRKENANNDIGHDETIDELKAKKATVVEDSDKVKIKNDEECADEEESDDLGDTAEKIEGDASENVDTEDNDKNIESQEQEPSYPPEEENNQVAQQFQVQTDWTNPPTPCPYKYRKLLNQTGSLTTDEAFFAALNLPERPHKRFPPGRENLSLKLRHYLLGVEADFFKMTEEANRLTSEVGRIAQEIFEPEQKCDACCACKQTRKTHLRWHATKTPHQVMDGVLTDENNNTQVIGALAMHSPAASVSSASEPPCVPSHEKFTKDLVIAGNTTTIDGEIIRQVVGVTKTLEHVKREALRPDVEILEVRNVPPCGCANEEKELELMDLSGGKNEELCYGKKFRPREGPAYSCGEFGRKDEAEGDCGCGEEELECLKEDSFGCGDDTGGCLDEDSRVELGHRINEEGIVEEEIGSPAAKEDAEKVCRTCGMKSKTRCMEPSKVTDFSEKSDRKGKERTGKTCSCGSLSDFLQIDLTRTTCDKPEKRYFKSEPSYHHGIVAKRESKRKMFSGELGSSIKFSRNKIIKAKDEGKMKKLADTEKKRKSSITKKEKRSRTIFGIPTKGATESGREKTSSEGGPYGYRTASEQALPIERTIAYLVDRHPPDYPAEEIPVRPGGRPCRCRENRNKRKTLLYGIGGLAKIDVRTTEETNAEKVIEGVCWLTPEPSIRRSDEYIPEYELYDSPYEKQVCGAASKVAANAGTSQENEEEESGIVLNSEDGDRTKDWENAFTDHYLAEFFTKTRENLPCWNKCSKSRKKIEEPRKLKVMKPVCECKYERKIVKRNEDRQNWIDRQRKLKSMKKQSFLHIDRIAKVASISSEEENIDQNQIIVSAVTMQTPYNTPIHSRSITHLPLYIPIPSSNIIETSVTTPPVAQKPAPARAEKPTNKNKPSKRSSSAKSSTSNYAANEVNIDRQVASDEAGIKVEPGISECTSAGGKTKRRMSFFDRLEDKLMIKMRRELKNMANEGFVSLKLPDYYKIPQLSYWISYRVRGMCFTEKYKKELMQASIKIWSAKAHKAKRKICAEYLRVARKDRDKINFDRARHWKGKIRKMKAQFYGNLRQATVDTSSEMWRTMEFGKFPNVLFKQAYFTYLPAKEADAHVIRPWPR